MQNRIKIFLIAAAILTIESCANASLYGACQAHLRALRNNHHERFWIQKNGLLGCQEKSEASINEVWNIELALETDQDSEKNLREVITSITPQKLSAANWNYIAVFYVIKAMKNKPNSDFSSLSAESMEEIKTTYDPTNILATPLSAAKSDADIYIRDLEISELNKTLEKEPKITKLADDRFRIEYKNDTDKKLYEGQCNSDIVPNGEGKMVYKDGRSYSGLWVAGEREGKGTQINQDLSIYEGLWKEDKFKEGHAISKAGVMSIIKDGKRLRGQPNNQTNQEITQSNKKIDLSALPRNSIPNLPIFDLTDMFGPENSQSYITAKEAYDKCWDENLLLEENQKNLKEQFMEKVCDFDRAWEADGLELVKKLYKEETKKLNQDPGEISGILSKEQVAEILQSVVCKATGCELLRRLIAQFSLKNHSKLFFLTAIGKGITAFLNDPRGNLNCLLISNYNPSNTNEEEKTKVLKTLFAQNDKLQWLAIQPLNKNKDSVWFHELEHFSHSLLTEEHLRLPNQLNVCATRIQNYTPQEVGLLELIYGNNEEYWTMFGIVGDKYDPVNEVSYTVQQGEKIRLTHVGVFDDKNEQVENFAQKNIDCKTILELHANLETALKVPQFGEGKYNYKKRIM